MTAERPTTVTLFVCGDVMTGRGIDQILSSPGNPALHEPSVTDANDYVRFAEEAYGPIPRRAPGRYVWGVAIEEWRRVSPDFRLINLETAVTRSDEYDRSKCIHYRMHPGNVECLTAAGIDCCTLANNHVLDWGVAGLRQTLETLSRAGISVVGAGRDRAAATQPCVRTSTAGHRVLFFGCGCASAGVPPEWNATERRPGVWQIDETSPSAVDEIAAAVSAVKRPGDVAVLSIHWGGNWGYRIPSQQRDLAHGVIDRAGVDVVHGHSSHHVKGIEVYRGCPILYGCGDFLTDYEGIPGFEDYRDDLGLMYFLTLDLQTGALARLEMTPTCLRHFRLERPSADDGAWLAARLDRECRRLGTTVSAHADGRLFLSWPA
jgi:poly-gamma-glutamate synthesis protein (capsule biosynthesis protein)